MGNKPDSVWTSSQLIKSLTQQAQLFIFAYSPSKKNLLAWSENAAELLGVKDSDITGSGNLFLRHVHPDDRFALMNDLEDALKKNSEYRATYRWIRPDNNQLRWLHCRGKVSQHTEEPVFEGVLLDLTAEFTGQVAHIAGPDSLSSILAAFPAMVFTLDKDLRIIRLNRPSSMHDFNFGDTGFLKQYFRIGQEFSDCFPKETSSQNLIQCLLQVLDNKSGYYKTRIETDDTIYNLEALPLAEKEAVHGLLILISDISSSVKLERDIARLNKAEGLRLLAHGVAHNFNNSLQSIVGYAASIMNNPDNRQLIESSGQAIIDTVNRASELGRQLLTFEQAGSEMASVVDINLSVMAATQRVEDLFSCGLKVSVAFGTPAPALANQDKLVEALIEILKNAKDHCHEGTSLNISTTQAEIKAGEVPELSAGTYAKISIHDRGSGMSDYVKERCLDPFYTTKETDQLSGLNLEGAGLGLSNAYAICRKFGGTLLVESKRFYGTNISLLFPVAQTAASAPAKLAADDEVQQPEILIIDDDLMVLQTVRQILESANLRCVVARDSRKAVNMLRKHNQYLKLAIVDALMPGLNGAAFLRRMKKISPHLKAIGFSGAGGDITRQLIEAGAITVLKKPVEPGLLKSAVSALLDAKAAA